MAVICPTVLAHEPHEFREQIERLAPFAERIHIDLADGVFTTNKLIELSHIWWPEKLTVDLHIMYESARPFIPEIIKRLPHLVIVHAESSGNYYDVMRPLKAAGIKTGVALLQTTPVTSISPALKDIDHILVFSGDLGHFGGKADLNLLTKVREIRALSKDVEIGWDGGLTIQNAKQVVTAGVNVLNVGSAIQQADDPQDAYDKLMGVIQEAL